ncbi:acetylornithine deacetylase/succinyl-diaminopimelate desuccinylase [Thiohalobacter thiocyanaticus]|uniref:Acetylornithine deacetylase/succinyl-diaminopimelate desuccinylase n=1 Tax=Thiohalobacter thiocyanaticus TaxID=585455 RepID=A0A1Z4VUN3_9GAMM|nr:hypothetical protein [Thiohalobacter thiocyanaticus]BAZ95165.1 acetylornithine deacetylase/succinyl-diaminopimelate desuccinylase [Thiohalobacter thiocyanaticus]
MTELKTRIGRTAAALLLALTLAPAQATLLDIDPDAPLLRFGSLLNQGADYDSASGRLSITGDPQALQFVLPGPFTGISGPRSLSMDFFVDSSGIVTGGIAGNDFELFGEIDSDGDGLADFTGLLLAGEIRDFGFQNLTATVDAMDLLFEVSGGSLAGQFAGFGIGVAMTLENSSFTGSFAQDFTSTRVKGRIGTAPLPPSQIPEPGTAWLLGLALPALLPALRRRTRHG